MWLVIFVIFFLIFYYYLSYESFENTNIYATRILGMAKHVRLNKFDRIDSISIKAPLPRVGETGCHTVVCPNWIPENSICYKCQ